MADNRQIIDLLINHTQIKVNKDKIGVTVKKDFIVFFSSRVNGFPYKKDAFFSLTICRKKNMIKGFDFTNYSEKDNFSTVQEFIDYLLNLI